MIKIRLEREQRCFVTSDTHYSHKNIVKGETSWSLERSANSVRDYNTREEMNTEMVDNFNRVIKPNDWLIHLGDWSFGGIEQIWEFRKRLNVKNILFVRGNHDHHIYPESKRIWIPKEDIKRAEELDITVYKKDVYVNWPSDARTDQYVMTQDLFNYVTVNPWVQVVYPNMSFYFDLFHRPMVTWEKISKSWMHLYGHIHSTPQFTQRFPGKCMDVGVDGNYMKPYDLMDVVKSLQTKPIDSFFSDDYHLKTV